MRTFSERGDLDILSPKAFSILRLCAIDGPLFPNLKTLELWPTIGGFVPFIPLFLSHRTLVVTIQFTEPHPKAVIASMITTLPTLCPNLREITLTYLPRHPMITAAVSGMLLAIDRDNLRWFHVDSPLTEEAREVVYGLSNLQGLTVVAEKSTPLPLLMFPDLYNLAVRYDCGSDWLRMFHRTTLEGLKDVVFLPRSEHIDDILEAFERVAVAASTQKTLSGFRFNTSHSWNPNYSSLLPFTQLETLDIEFSCDDGCSSSVDDDIIADIAQAMPKLEILCLGRAPCRTPTGVTAKGLTTLAYHCLHLSTLRIHFQVASLHPPVIPEVTSSGQLTVPRGDCALTDLEVGEIPVPEESTSAVALTLLHIFPHIENIEYINEQWRKVADAIDLAKQSVDRSGKMPSLTHLGVKLMTPTSGVTSEAII